MQGLLRVFTLLALTGLPAAAQSTPVWTHAAAAEIGFFRVSPLGNVILGTPGRLTALDPETGQVSWTFDHYAAGEFQVIPESPYAVFQTGERLTVIELGSGERRWDSESAGVDTVAGFLAVPGHGLLLVYGTGGADRSVLVAADLGSGHVRWRHADPFLTTPKRYGSLGSGQTPSDNLFVGAQPAAWVSDTTFLLHVSEDGPVLVNANTGAFLWQASSLAGERPPRLLDDYPAALIMDSIVVVPYDRYVSAIRLRDGSPLWAKPVEVPSRAMQLGVTSRGLLVRGARREFDANKDDPYVQLLDPATGTSRWRWKRGHGLLNGKVPPDPVSPFVVRGGHVYFAWSGDAYRVALSDGKSEKITKLRFRNGEEPWVVENREGGVLHWSAQNLLLVDSSGAVRYQAYYPSPPVGWLAHVGIVALRVALQTASNALEDARARRTGAPPMYEYYGNPFLRMRYAAAANADAYVYIVTAAPDSGDVSRSLLVRVHKDQNAVEGRVWLTGKRPDFRVDPFTATAYVRTGPRAISAFKF